MVRGVRGQVVKGNALTPSRREEENEMAEEAADSPPLPNPELGWWDEAAEGEPGQGGDGKINLLLDRGRIGMEVGGGWSRGRRASGAVHCSARTDERSARTDDAHDSVDGEALPGEGGRGLCGLPSLAVVVAEERVAPAANLGVASPVLLDVEVLMGRTLAELFVGCCCLLFALVRSTLFSFHVRSLALSE